MATRITQTGNPALWAILNTKWLEDSEKGWVVSGGIHYQVGELTDGTMFFLGYTNEELYDSRSITESKQATYKKLDEE
jgi:hypothetical protein